MAFFMNTMTITVSNETEFNKINIGSDISHLTFKWADGLKEWNKSSLQYDLRNYLYDILQNIRHIQVLDLSRLDGLKDAYYPAKYLQEIYYPDSIKSIYFTGNRYIRKIHAQGAKEITINQVPSLEIIEYGPDLEELSLAGTGISNIELPKNIKLRSGAFKGCKQLKSVILKSGTDVPPSTFEDCNSLYEVTLPDDLLVIEPNAFSGCSNLRYIYGGKNVKQIFPSAFKGCFNLVMMECKDFYRYTDLSITDKQWLDKYRPYTPLANVKAHIKKFVQELNEKEIDNPAEYVANSFFHEEENHLGFVLKYQTRIRGWMVWSLSHKCFLATKGDKYRLHEDDVVTFTIVRKPNIIINDSLCIQYPMVFIDDASSLKIVEPNKDESDGYECEFLLEYFKPKVSLLDKYKEIVHNIDGLNITQIID